MNDAAPRNESMRKDRRGPKRVDDAACKHTTMREERRGRKRLRLLSKVVGCRYLGRSKGNGGLEAASRVSEVVARCVADVFGPASLQRRPT